MSIKDSLLLVTEQIIVIMIFLSNQVYKALLCEKRRRLIDFSTSNSISSFRVVLETWEAAGW